MAFLVILNFSVGYSLLATPASQQVHSLLIPYPVWGWLWMAAAVNAATGVFARNDRVQYSLSAMFKVAWAGVQGHIWLAQHQPRGWVGLAVWLAFAVLILVINGWPEPSPPVIVVSPSSGQGDNG